MTKYKQIGLIAKRAIEELTWTNPLQANLFLDISMDIEAADATCPIDLGALYRADIANFAHDIFGIRRHLNRETKQLENCFVPRFAK